MVYPEPNQTGVNVARAKYAAACEAVSVTDASIVEAEAAVREAAHAKGRLIRDAASGRTVRDTEHAEAEGAEDRAAASLARLQKIRETQHGLARQAEAGIRAAAASGHRERLVVAIRDRAMAAADRADAVAAAARADARLSAANDVAKQALGAGFPAPHKLPGPLFYTLAEQEAAYWADSSPAVLRTIWGDLATEAFAQADPPGPGAGNMPRPPLRALNYRQSTEATGVAGRGVPEKRRGFSLHNFRSKNESSPGA